MTLQHLVEPADARAAGAQLQDVVGVKEAIFTAVGAQRLVDVGQRQVQQRQHVGAGTATSAPEKPVR